MASFGLRGLTLPAQHRIRSMPGVPSSIRTLVEELTRAGSEESIRARKSGAVLQSSHKTRQEAQEALTAELPRGASWTDVCRRDAWPNGDHPDQRRAVHE